MGSRSVWSGSSSLAETWTEVSATAAQSIVTFASLAETWTEVSGTAA